MEHTKSKYLIWLETLHREYTDQTNITLFGKQAMLIKLLADTHEVKCRFENILTKLQTKKLLLEEDDIEYKEWYDPNKWKINNKMLVDHDVAETLGINNKDNVINTYPNKLIEAFEDDSKIDNNRFNLLVSLLYVFDTIVDEQAICVAIDNEVKQLQLILQKIENEKNNEKSSEEYSEYFNKKKDEYLNFFTKSSLEGEHKKWKKGIYDNDIMNAYKVRRAELVLSIFDSGFLDDLKAKYHSRTPKDIFGFKEYSFEKWENREIDALKYFICLTQLCPFKDDMIDFSDHAKIGKYIYEEHIEKPMVKDFLKNMEQIILVQEEMKALNAQKIDEEGDKLHSNEAKQLWEKCKDMQWIDDNLQPKVSEPKAAVIASVMSDILNLSPRWEAFENLWGIKEMPNKLCKAQNAKYYPEFFKTVEKKLA